MILFLATWICVNNPYPRPSAQKLAAASVIGTEKAPTVGAFANDSELRSAVEMAGLFSGSGFDHNSKTEKVSRLSPTSAPVGAFDGNQTTVIANLKNIPPLILDHLDRFRYQEEWAKFKS